MKFNKKLISIFYSLVVFTAVGCGGDGGGGSTGDIALAKDAVTELRTWATKIRELQTTGSNKQLELSQSMATTGTQVAYDTVAESLSYSVEAVLRAYKRNLGADGTYPLIDYVSASYFYPEYDVNLNLIYPPDPTGNIVIDNTAGTASITGGTLYNDTVNIVMTLPEATVSQNFIVDVTSASITNAKAFAQIDVGTVTMNYPVSVDLFDPTTSNDVLPESASMSLQVTVGQLESEFDNAVKFVGKLEASVVLQSDLGLDLNPEHVLLSGTYSNELGEYLSGSFEAFMRNAATFNPIPESLDLPVDNVMNYYFSVNLAGNTEMTMTYPNSGRVDVFEFVPAVGGGGTVNINGFPEFSGTVYPDFASFLAQSFYTSGGGYDSTFDGVNFRSWYFDFPASYDETATEASPVAVSGKQYGYGPSEDATRWRDVDGVIKYTAKFDGMPEASIVLEADVLDYKKVAGKLTISYDNVMIELSLDNNNFQDNATTGTKDLVDADLIVTVTEDDGTKVVLTVKMSSTTTSVDSGFGYPIYDTTYEGELSVNGTVVGTVVEDIAPDTVIINYTDGTFESLVF